VVEAGIALDQGASETDAVPALDILLGAGAGFGLGIANRTLISQGSGQSQLARHRVTQNGQRSIRE
jgi:hypothetical protein